MNPGTLREHFKGGHEAIREVSETIATLEARREGLNSDIEVAKSARKHLQSSLAADQRLDTLPDDVPAAEKTLFYALHVSGEFSHTGADSLERLELINETLEAWRKLLESGPYLVTANYDNSSYPDRKTSIIADGPGDMINPVVVEREDGFYFEDDNGTSVPIYTATGGLPTRHLSSTFKNFHEVRTKAGADARVARGADEIEETVISLKETDITAFFVAVMHTHDFVPFSPRLIELPLEQQTLICKAIAHNIAVTSLAAAESEAFNDHQLRDILGGIKVLPEFEPYLQLAGYFLDHPEFYEKASEVFGYSFDRAELLAQAFDMQNAHLRVRLQIATPLGDLTLKSTMAEWPNGIKYVYVPLPTSKGGGLS